MCVFSRPVVWLAAVAVAGLLSPRSAAAQAAAPDGPGSDLMLSGSVFGGYDTDITGAAPIEEDVPTDAANSGMIVSADYRNRTEKIAFGVRGNVDSRFYLTDQPVNATSYAGSASVGAQIASRLRVDGFATVSYSPQFVFSLLPDTSGLPNNLPFPTQDYGLSLRDSVNRTLSANATLQVTKRSSFTVSYGRNKYNYIDDNYDMTSRTYGGLYSHTVSRYASLRLGYSETKANYPAFLGAPRHDLTQRSIDAGIDYSRPLSVSRRTTVGFGTGSATVDNGVETFFTVTADAYVRHQLARRWRLNAAYSRGLGVVGGFSEPFFADSVSVDVHGEAANRMIFTASTGFSNGNVGLGSAADNYKSVQASMRFETAVKRDRVNAFVSYLYYGYTFQDAIFIAPGVPPRVSRHGIRGGLVVRMPVFQERKPRATR